MNLCIHLVLTIGAITMVYPFLLMISSSVKSAVDNTRLTLIPPYLHDSEALFQKYLESRYNEESNRLTDNYSGKWLAFSEVRAPQRLYPAIYRDWQDFLAQNRAKYGSYDFYAAEHYGRGVYPRNQRVIRKLLKAENEHDLNVFNNRYSTGVQTWEEIVIEEKEILSRNFISSDKGYLGRFQEFKLSLPDWHRNYINLDGSFAQAELIPLFGGDLKKMNDSLGTSYTEWDQIILSRECPPLDNPLRDFWIHYVKEVVNIHHILIMPGSTPKFRDFLRAKYSSLNLLNQTWGTGYQSFEEVTIPETIPDSGAFVTDISYFVQYIAAPEDLTLRSIQEDFRDYLVRKYRDTDSLAKSWGLYEGYLEQAVPSSDYPTENLVLRELWRDFVRSVPAQISLKSGARQEYLDYLTRRYGQNGVLDLRRVNRILGANYRSLEDITPATTQPISISLRSVWQDFVTNYVNPSMISLREPEKVTDDYRSFLRERFRNDTELYRHIYRLGEDIRALPFPQQQIEYALFSEHEGNIRKEFLVRNYAMVLEQMLSDSRSLRNTLIYCLLSILFAITVNPLAAYALSRFKPKFGYQLIMVFMLTMAFPAMVIGIPNFLMLKKLNLLNTFWALVLPAAADGYFIFLLKGFFDSLPKELYESARIDGAGEFRMFWQFTLYLSKPILAVIALGAFNAAYRNFLFAFIVCQDQTMWTLMVHIYELMQRASLSVGYAALVIAAIPTLMVFVFFQNVIIKGIVIPMEK